MAAEGRERSRVSRGDGGGSGAAREGGRCRLKCSQRVRQRLVCQPTARRAEASIVLVRVVERRVGHSERRHCPVWCGSAAATAVDTGERSVTARLCGGGGQGVDTSIGPGGGHTGRGPMRDPLSTPLPDASQPLHSTFHSDPTTFHLLCHHHQPCVLSTTLSSVPPSPVVFLLTARALPYD